MKITIVGAGNIGGTLGGKWAAAGHQVTFGVRDPRADKVQALVARMQHGVRAMPVPESIDGAEVVLFAIPGGAMSETVHDLGERLDGKMLLDASNDVNKEPMHSLDALRRAAPNSPLFRAFSNLGWENFADPVLDALQVDLLYCGDDGVARSSVERLIADVGLRPVYLGGLDKATLIDALTRVWFSLALQQGHGRHLAFKVLGL